MPGWSRCANSGCDQLQQGSPLFDHTGAARRDADDRTPDLPRGLAVPSAAYDK